MRRREGRYHEPSQGTHTEPWTRAGRRGFRKPAALTHGLCSLGFLWGPSLLLSRVVVALRQATSEKGGATEQVLSLALNHTRDQTYF